MGIHFLDTYTHLDSTLHRAPATLKFLFSLTLVVATVAMPLRLWPWFAIHAAILIISLLLSRIPIFFLLMRLLYIEPFVLGAAILTLFQPNGFWIFLTVLIKTTLSITTMLLLANTTPFTELLEILKRLRIPGLLITIIALMYRYLYIVVDEATRMRKARRARTFSRLPTFGWANLSAVLSRLFVRTNERSERTYAAMCARGWK